LASILKGYTGNWHAVFVVSAVMNVVVVFAALFILKPMREAHHSENARIGPVASSAKGARANDIRSCRAGAVRPYGEMK